MNKKITSKEIKKAITVLSINITIYFICIYIIMSITKYIYKLDISPTLISDISAVMFTAGHSVMLLYIFIVSKFYGENQTIKE